MKENLVKFNDNKNIFASNIKMDLNIIKYKVQKQIKLNNIML